MSSLNPINGNAPFSENCFSEPKDPSTDSKTSDLGQSHIFSPVGKRPRYRLRSPSPTLGQPNAPDSKGSISSLEDSPDKINQSEDPQDLSSATTCLALNFLGMNSESPKRSLEAKTPPIEEKSASAPNSDSSTSTLGSPIKKKYAQLQEANIYSSPQKENLQGQAAEDETSILMDRMFSAKDLNDLEIDKLVTDLDNISFKKRNIFCPTIHSATSILEIAKFLHEAQGKVEDCKLAKETNGTLNFLLNATPKEERAKLLQKIEIAEMSGNPCYQILISICKKKYYKTIEPLSPPRFPASPEMSSPYQQVSEYVSLVASHELESSNTQTKTDRQLLKEVKLFADSLSKIFSYGRPVDSVFHFTATRDGVIGILKNGIQVTHQKLKEGAFVSTKLETGFGKFGVAVSKVALAAQGSDLRTAERRPNQEQAAIWIGSASPLPVLSYYVIYSSDTTEKELEELNQALKENGFPSTVLISSDVQAKYLEFAEELSTDLPIPVGTPLKDLERWDRESEK